MEAAAAASCAAPMIYATGTQTHTHTPMHPRTRYAWRRTSADEIACINTRGLAGDTEPECMTAPVLC